MDNQNCLCGSAGLRRGHSALLACADLEACSVILGARESWDARSVPDFCGGTVPGVTLAAENGGLGLFFQKESA
jgi:hypothetical protein